MSKTFNQPLQSPDKSIQQFGIRMKFKTLFTSDDIGCGRKKNTAITLTGHSFVTCPCPSNSWPNSAKWSVISHPDNLPVVQYAGQYWCSQIRVSINLCKVNPNAQRAWHGIKYTETYHYHKRCKPIYSKYNLRSNKHITFTAP